MPDYARPILIHQPRRFEFGAGTAEAVGPWADAEGFRAQGCAELLQHSYDIANGLGEAFRPPDDLAGRIVARLFPWAPDAEAHPDRWEALLWACGRVALPGHPPIQGMTNSSAGG